MQFLWGAESGVLEHNSGNRLRPIYVPLEYVDGLLAAKREVVGLIVHAVSFQDFQPV